MVPLSVVIQHELLDPFPQLISPYVFVLAKLLFFHLNPALNFGIFIIYNHINTVLRPYLAPLLPRPFAARPALSLPVIDIGFIPAVALHKTHQLEKSFCSYRYRHFPMSFQYPFRNTVSLCIDTVLQFWRNTLPVHRPYGLA